VKAFKVVQHDGQCTYIKADSMEVQKRFVLLFIGEDLVAAIYEPVGVVVSGDV
jgi:hypothetical protein